MADDLDQLEEGVGRRIIDTLGRAWNPDLHPRDRRGRFISVFKRIMAMPVGSTRSLNDVVDDAPHISVANIFRTQRGFEIRAQTRSGPAGIGVTVQQMSDNPQVLDESLSGLNNVNPYPNLPRCPHCNSPSPGGGYLPGHEAAERLAALRRGIELPDKPVGLRQGLRNLRAMYADPEIRQDIRDRGETISAVRGPRGVEAFRQMRGKPSKVGKKIDKATIRKAIADAIRSGSNRYIFWDKEQEAFTAQSRFLFEGENLNERGQMVLRGTVDKDGNFKAWNESRPWSRPDEPNAEELVDNWLFKPDQERGEGRQPRSAPEEVTEDPLDLDRVNAELDALNLARDEANNALATLNPGDEPEDQNQRDERRRLVGRINEQNKKIERLEQARDSLERGEVPEQQVINIVDYDALKAEIARLEQENKELWGKPDVDQRKFDQNDFIIKGLKAQIEEAPDMPDDEVEGMAASLISANDAEKRDMVSALPESMRSRIRSEMPSVASAREQQRIRELMDEIEPPLDAGAGSSDEQISVVAPISRAPIKGSAVGLENFFLNDLLDDEAFEAQQARVQQLRDIADNKRLLRQDAKRKLDNLDELDTPPSQEVYDRLEKEYERAVAEHLDAHKQLREVENVKREAQILPNADLEFNTVEIGEIQRFKDKAKREADEAGFKVRADFDGFYLRVTGRRTDPDVTWTFDDMADFVDLRDDDGNLINVAEGESDPEGFARDFLEDIYDANWKARVEGKARLAIKEAEQADKRIAQQKSNIVSGSKAGKRSRQRGNVGFRDPDARLQRAKANDLSFAREDVPIVVVEDRIIQDPNGKSDGVWVSNDGFFVIVDFRYRLAEEADRFGIRDGGTPYVAFEKGPGGKWNAVNLDEVERRRPLTSSERRTLEAEIRNLENDIGAGAPANSEDREQWLAELQEKQQQLDRGWVASPRGEVSQARKEIEDIQVNIASFRDVLDDDATIGGKTKQEWESELEVSQRELAELEGLKSQGFLVAELVPKLDSQGNPVRDASGNIVKEIKNREAARTARQIGRFRSFEGAVDAARKIAAKNDEKVNARRRGDSEPQGINVIPPDFDRLIDEQEEALASLESSKEIDPSLTQISARGGSKLDQRDKVEFNSDGVSISAIDERIFEVKSEIARLKGLRDGETPKQHHMQDLQELEDFERALDLRNEVSEIEERLDSPDLSDDEKAELSGSLAAKRKQLDDMGDIGGLDIQFSDGGSDQALARNLRDTDMPEFMAMDFDRIVAQNHAFSMVVAPERERIDDLDVVLSSAFAAHVDAPDGEKRKLFVYAHPDGGFFYSPVHPHYYERAANPRRDEFDEKEAKLLEELDDIPRPPRDALQPEKEKAYAERRKVIGKLNKLRDERSAASKRRPRVLAVVDGDNHAQVFGMDNAERVDNAKFIGNAAEAGRLERERDVVLNARDDVPEDVAAYDIALEKYVPRVVHTRRTELRVANRATVRVGYTPPPDIDVELTKQERYWQDEIETLNKKKKNIEGGHHDEKASILEGIQHELDNAQNQLRAVRRDIVDRKSYESDPERYEREQSVSERLREGMQEAIKRQQESGKPVQVYMDGDEIEFDTKKYDSTRNRIATITGGTGGKNPRINWKNDELKEVYDDSGIDIKSRIKNMFSVENVGDGERIDLRLRSKAIVRNHRNAVADDKPENVRAFQPAVYKIRQNPDGTFKVFLDSEADPSGIAEEYGDYVDIDSALRAVHAIEMNAIGRSGNRVFRLPESDEFANWSTRNGRLIASPDEKLGVSGVFAIGERWFDDGDGGLFRKFEVARLVPGGDRDGVERRRHDDIESAKQDVDERLRAGFVPESNISWKDVDGMRRGRAEYDGQKQFYDISHIRSVNEFVYNAKRYKSLDDALAAAEADEVKRRQEIDDAKRGVKPMVEVDKPLPDFQPGTARPRPKNTAVRNESAAQSPAKSGKVSGSKGAKAQAQSGLRLTPDAFIRAEKPEDEEFIRDLFGGRSPEEVQAILAGYGDAEIIVFDYETNGVKGGAARQVPIQIGAVRIKNGQVQDSFDVWINLGDANLGEFANAVRPENPDDPDGPTVPATAEWLREQPISLQQAHQMFADWIGDNNALMLSQNGWTFDDIIRQKQFELHGIDKPNIRGSVDNLVIARKLHAQIADESQKPKGNSLGALYKFYTGEDLPNAHNASVDAEATATVLRAILGRMQEMDVDPVKFFGPRRDRSKEEMLPEERIDVEIQEKAQEIASRPQSPDDDDFEVAMPGAEPPKRERVEFKDVTEAIESPLPEGQRGQIGTKPPSGPQDFARDTLKMSDADVVEVEGRKWTGELFNDRRTEYSEQVPTQPAGVPVEGRQEFKSGPGSRIQIKSQTPRRDTEQASILSTPDGEGGFYTLDYRGRALVDKEGVSDLYDRTFWVEDLGYDMWTVMHVDKDGVVTQEDFKVRPTERPALDPERGPASLVDSQYTPIDTNTGKSLLSIINDRIAANERQRKNQEDFTKLRVGGVDPRNGQKIKEIIEHDNGQVEIIYEAGSRPRERPKKDTARIEQQLVRLQDAKDKAEAEGDVERVESIRRAMARLETPVENVERRGEEDFVPGRGMKIGGVWRSEIPDPDSPDFIQSVMQDDDGDRIGLDVESPDFDEDDGFAMRRSLISMSAQSRNASQSPQFVRVQDVLDNAMNSKLTPVDGPNYSRKELNDRVRDLVLNGASGQEVDLADAIDFDNLIDVRSAVLRKENGYVSLVMIRSDGSKVSEFTKERTSPNSYFPWLQRSLAYHGNMETPASLPPQKIKAVMDDAMRGDGFDGPAAQWIGHMGQIAHEAVMQRLGLTPLHNGYDGFAVLRRNDDANLGFTRMGPDGVPEISLHPAALVEADPVEVFLHENLHVVSPGINNPNEVFREGFVGHEEGLVHAYTQQLLPDIRRRMGYDDITQWDPSKDRSPYKAWAMAYEAMRVRSGMSADDFYGRLIRVHPRDREDMLRRMASSIVDPDQRRKYLDQINREFAVLRGNPSNKYPHKMPTAG